MVDLQADVGTKTTERYGSGAAQCGNDGCGKRGKPKSRFIDADAPTRGSSNICTNQMRTKTMTVTVFKSESDEADWWASREGRSFIKQKIEGSPLVARLNKTASVQIALGLPETDLAEARRIATRKGIGYQTLLKMLLHEGLQREARRD